MLVSPSENLNEKRVYYIVSLFKKEVRYLRESIEPTDRILCGTGTFQQKSPLYISNPKMMAFGRIQNRRPQTTTCIRDERKRLSAFDDDDGQ